MREQHRVRGQRGELAVEVAVGVAPARRCRAVRGRRTSIASSSALDLASSRRPRCGGERGDAGLEQQPRLEQGERARRRRGRASGRRASRSSASAATNEPAPRRVSTTPRTCSAAERLAHRRAADPELLGELALGRQPLAGREPPARGCRRRAGRRSARSAGGRERRQWLDSGSRLELVRSLNQWYRTAHGRRPSRPSIPRPAQPARSTTRRRADEVDAAVGCRRARLPRPRARATATRRAALLRAAAARLRARGDELVAVCGRETGLPEGRLRGELERTAGQLEAFADVVEAGDYVEAIIDTPDPDAKPIPRPGPPPHAPPHRPGRGLRREQLPARLQHRGRRHRLGARRRLPGRRQGPPVAPGDRRARRARAPRRRRRRRPARGHVRAPARRRRSRSARRWSTTRDRRRRLHRLAAGGARDADRAAAGREPIPVYAEMGCINPVVVTAAALAARADAIADGLVGVGRRTSAASCARSPASSSCPTGDAGDAFARAVAERLDARRAGGAAQRARSASARRRPSSGSLSDAERPRRLGGRRSPARASAHQPAAFEAPASASAEGAALLEEHFGPVVVLLALRDARRAAGARSSGSSGQLTGDVHAEPDDDADSLRPLTRAAGRARRAA